jgi:hypothetical protein
MKKKQHPFTSPRDTPATRKRRLQERLQELSDKSERELTALIQSLDKVKASFKKKPK